VVREISAAVINAAGEPTSIETLRLDDPRAGEVLVRMTSAGVCHSDLHVRDGHWKRPGPIVMGHEVRASSRPWGPGWTRASSGGPWR
jgi:Zn-dependent alcohol dehydrogenase